MSSSSLTRLGLASGLTVLPLLALGMNLLPLQQISSLQSSSLVVTTLSDNIADDGLLSLREAIAAANSGQGGTSPTISFAPNLSGTLTVTEGEFVLSHDVTITTGTRQVVLDAARNSRFFNIKSGNVFLTGLTLANGLHRGSDSASGAAGGEGRGGAIYNAGKLNLTDVLLRRNTAMGGTGGTGRSGRPGMGMPGTGGTGGPGGTGGVARGGAIFNAGTLTLVTTTLSDNIAQGGVGGIGGSGSPGMGGYGRPGRGGNGGNAYGGAIYSAGPLQTTRVSYADNKAIGGNGGLGGVNSGSTNPTRGASGASGSGFDDNVRDIRPVAINATVEGNQSVPLSAKLNGTGEFALTYSLVSGSLPTGLNLDPTTGVISGIPQDAAKELQVQFKVNDGYRDSNIATVTFNIGASESRSLIVNTSEDVVNAFDQQTSLREAIAYAVGGTAGDSPVVTFAPPVTGLLNITGDQFGLTHNVTIDGGANRIVLDPSQRKRLFHIYGINGDINVTLRNLTLQNGYMSGYAGGALYSDSGTHLTIQNCTFASNLAYGSMGGAIYATQGSLRIQNSTFVGNTGATEGGAIYLQDIPTTIQNCTIVGNRANSTGGGIFTTGPLTLRNTLVVGNISPGTEVYGSFTGAGNPDNIIGGTAAEAGLDVDSQGDPILAGNGGPTPTIGLVPNGYAVGRGNNAYAPAGGFDQRGNGFARIRGTNIDVGAFELQLDDDPTPTATPIPTATPAPTATPVPTATPIPVGIQASGQVLSSEPDATYNSSVLVPCANAQVLLEGGGKNLTTTTDSTGRYTFYGLTPSTYTVRVMAVDTTGSGNTTAVPFVFKKNHTIAKKDSATGQVTVPSFTFFSLWGRVQSKSGTKKNPALTPISGATVQLSKTSTSTYPAFSRSTATDSNGFYVFSFLGRASFKVMANVSGLTFKNTVAMLPGTKRPIAPSLRRDLIGNPSTVKGKDITFSSIHSS